MNSLKSIIDSRLDLVKHFTDKSYCVCKKCGLEWKTRLVDGTKEYDLKSPCCCGSKEYENKYLLDNNSFVIQVLEDLVKAYRTEIHEYLAPSNIADKETQIRNHIKDIMTKIAPIVDGRISAMKAQYTSLSKKRSSYKQNLDLECKIANIEEWYQKYCQLDDDFKALVSFRHFETFCMYIDRIFGSKKPLQGSRHLFKGFYYYANSMVLNKDVHFIEKQCFAGAGKSITDCALIAFILGYDINSVIVKVFGNKDNIGRGIGTVIQIMTSKEYAKIFPYYAKYDGKEADIFAIDKPANGELRVAGSYQPSSILMRSKNESFDGVRVQYLFVDDITQSKDAEKREMHKSDIDKFNRSWFERKDNLEDTFIIASGTTYHIDDFLSTLKHTFGVDYAKETPFRFTTISNKNLLGLKWLSVFCVIYGLDENDKSTYEERFPASVFIYKRSDDPRNFMAMVQQQPLPPLGAPFDYDNLPNLYGKEGIPHLADRSQEVCRASLDPARKGKDFHSMPIIVSINGRMFLQDCIFDQFPPEKLPLVVVDMIEKHHIIHLDIENNTDTTFDVLIKKLLKERGINYCNVTSFYSWKKKDEKISEYETAIKSICYPERDVYSPNSQMGKFMYWLTAYNYETPPKHDDSVDSLANFSQTFIVNKSTGSKVRSLSRRI